jgi:hypothetical protein
MIIYLMILSVSNSADEIQFRIFVFSLFKLLRKHCKSSSNLDTDIRR